MSLLQESLKRYWLRSNCCFHLFWKPCDHFSSKWWRRRVLGRLFLATSRLCRPSLLKFSTSQGPCCLCDQSQNLICGQCKDAEHKMARHFGVASHPHRAPAELVFQTRVYPFHRRAFVIRHILGIILKTALEMRSEWPTVSNKMVANIDDFTILVRCGAVQSAIETAPFRSLHF
jgi:hypothetical protein